MVPVCIHVNLDRMGHFMESDELPDADEGRGGRAMGSDPNTPWDGIDAYIDT